MLNERHSSESPSGGSSRLTTDKLKASILQGEVSSVAGS
jgi:hypothetical protein